MMKLKVHSSGLTVTFLLVALLFVPGCQRKAEFKKAESQIVPVKVVKAGLKDIYKTLDYIGDIKAQEEAMVYPKASGKIIDKVKEDGRFVEKGEVIAYIDRDEVGLQFEKLPVTSPLKGVVGRFYVDIGSNVTPQTAIALVVDMDKVKIALNIPEKYLPDISLNQVADIYVDAYPEERFTGTVTKISPVFDLDTRTAPIKITIDNKGHRLKSGMFARVSLITKEIKGAILVLKEAVMGKEPDLYVYTVEDNMAILKRIKVGIRQNGYFEVKEGLKQGDMVVIMGQQMLKDGAKVKME
jgi:multidrug efflux pump subunit AcrA (membrane-fusion protein)